MHEVLVGLQFESILSRFCTCLELTQGGKFRHCVKIFWLQRKCKMLCIKMFWTVTLWDGVICSSNPCVEFEKTLPVRGVQRFGSGMIWFRSELTGSLWMVPLWGAEVDGTGRQLCNACDAVSESVHGMPVSHGFTVPGSRGISVPCLNPVLFY